MAFPLEITADPTAVYALAGAVVEMSAVVSGGQSGDYSDFGEWVIASDGILSQTNTSTELERIDAFAGEYRAKTLNYKDLKPRGRAKHNFKLSSIGTSLGGQFFYGFRAECDVPTATALYEIRIGHLDKVDIAINRTSDFDFQFDIVHNPLFPLDVSTNIVFDNVTPSTVTISQNGVVLYHCSKVVVINTATIPTRLKQYGWNGTILYTSEFYENLVDLKLTDTSTGTILSTSSPYSYLVNPDDSGKIFQWEATDGIDTVTADVPIDYVRLTTIEEGDPKLFFGSNGATLNFVNGLPVMDNEFENVVNLQILVNSDSPLNRLSSSIDETIGSNLPVEIQKTITRDQMQIVESAAVDALSSLVDQGIFKSVTARMAYITNEGYGLELTITPPVGSDKKLSFVRYNENWISRQSVPS